MTSQYQRMVNPHIPAPGLVVSVTTAGYDGPSAPVDLAKSATVLPAPATDGYAWQARQLRRAEAGPNRFPVLTRAKSLRAGLRIGRWTLTGEHAERRTPSGWQRVSLTGRGAIPDGARYLAHCDCGTERRVCVTSLVTGESLSCGCYCRDRTRYCAEQRRQARAAMQSEREQAAAYADAEAEDRRIAREARRIAAGGAR